MGRLMGLMMVFQLEYLTAQIKEHHLAQPMASLSDQLMGSHLVPMRVNVMASMMESRSELHSEK